MCSGCECVCLLLEVRVSGMKGTYRRGYGVSNGEGINRKSYLFFRTKYYGSIFLVRHKFRSARWAREVFRFLRLFEIYCINAEVLYVV